MDRTSALWSTLLLGTIVLRPTACAQPSSSGTELWVTFMENLDLQFNTPPYFELVISSDVSTQGEVQVPYTGFAIPFSVQAQDDTVITLPTNIYYPEGDEAVFNFGLRVVADDPVSVYAYHHRLYFSEACMALPTTRLGTDHLVLAHEDAVSTQPSAFAVLATVDSTVVEVVPSVLTVGFRPPGTPYTVQLDAGQVFQQQAFGDLSGSRVRSLDPAKPIAVYGGAKQARVNCALAADDHLFQQVEPLSGWGRIFRIVPFLGRGGDELRVLASVDGTTVELTGQAPVVLDSGEVASFFAAVPLTVQSSAPVAVGQFNDSQGCNPAMGDPCYLWVHPFDRTDQRVIWTALTGAGTPYHFVNIVAQGEAGPPVVLLDAVDISAQLQPMAGVSGVFWGQFPVSAGMHRVESAQGFQAWAYGMGDYNSYAFPLGYGTADLTTSIAGVDATGHAPQAWMLSPGDELDRTRVDLPPQAVLELRDASGRLVRRFGAGEPLIAPAAAGSYVLHTRDASHTPVRLFVH
ncbi:MAG: IgGFc-binding protein [Flavobacteriales bacterium]|nr:IgGFc-binding protein [Flavobacteriales bacterium]MBK7940585.1 IgGFc-binding protein [Flavobacteriales bacterium]MBK8950328.1 IgGFc-binding protein [Flavobacteriales bacterium]MBK9700996.1 IgGFc-binding protein [Flavobacteriales bacterium]